MTKDEAVKMIGTYRSKVEKIEKKIKFIQMQQEYRDEICFGFYMDNVDFLVLTIGLNLEALEMSVNRTLALYQDGFISQTERYIEDETKSELKKVRKALREIDEKLERAVTEKSVDWDEMVERELVKVETDTEELRKNGW